jgi:hypothetical protein
MYTATRPLLHATLPGYRSTIYFRRQSLGDNIRALGMTTYLVG